MGNIPVKPSALTGSFEICERYVWLCSYVKIFWPPEKNLSQKSKPPKILSNKIVSKKNSESHPRKKIQI